MVRRRLADPDAADWLPFFHEFLNSLTIESKETGRTLIGRHLWGSQQRFLDALMTGLAQGIRWYTVLKGRQQGISTISLGFDLFWLFLHPGIQGALVCDNEGNRDKFRFILRQFSTGLPPHIGYPIVDDNKTFMSWNVNGELSVLDFLTAGKRRSNSLGTSRAYRFAHLTETSRYGDPRDLDSFMQTLSETHPDRLFINESTANGFNHFQVMWDQAREDRLSQMAIFNGWWSRDDQMIKKSDKRYREAMSEPWTEEELELRDEVARDYGVLVTEEQLAWYRWREQTRSLDEGMLHESQPWTERQAFVLSGRSFFSLRRIEKELAVIRDGRSADFKAFRYYLGTDFTSTRCEPAASAYELDLRVWEEPLPWGRYVIGADVAYGRSDYNDSHAISVWRCYADQLVQVAEWGTTEPETYQVVWVLAHLASVYRNSMINYDVGGPGQVVKTDLDRLRRELRSKPMRETVAKLGWEEAVEGISWYLYHRPDSLGVGYAYGLRTNVTDLKLLLMNEFRNSYTLNMLRIRSGRLMTQMQHTVQEGGDIGPSARGKGKDDFMFAAVYAHRAWLEWVQPGMIEDGYTREKAALDDREMMTRQRVNPVRGIVEHFFQDYAREQINPPQTWAEKRGFDGL